MSVIVTIIVYTFTWLIIVGYMDNVLLDETDVINVGVRPVAESITAETVTISPISISVIGGSR